MSEHYVDSQLLQVYLRLGHGTKHYEGIRCLEQVLPSPHIVLLKPQVSREGARV